MRDRVAEPAGREGRAGRDAQHPDDGPVRGLPLRLGPGRVPLVGEQVAPHQGQRPVGRGARADQVAVVRAPDRLAGQDVELHDVPPVGEKGVAEVAPLHPLGPDHRPRPADEHVQVALGLRRPRVRPDGLREGVGIDGGTTGEREPLEQRAGLAAAEDREVGAVQPEVTEQPYAQPVGHGGHHAALPRQRTAPGTHGAAHLTASASSVVTGTKRN